MSRRRRLLPTGIYDARRLFDQAGNLRPIHCLDERDQAMIAGFEVIRRNDGRGAWTDTVLRVKLVNRANYVEMAAKYHGLLQDRLEVTDGRGLEDRIAAARARLAQLRLQRAIEATQGVLTSAEQADAPR